MKNWVLDASIAVKWFLRDEPLADQAAWLAEEFRSGAVGLTVPDLFWPEFGNIVWKAARRGRIGFPEAEAVIIRMRSSGAFPTIPSLPLLKDALALALANDRTVCDCIYVALAIERRCELLTADERLVNALGSRFPVRWLGAAVH